MNNPVFVIEGIDEVGDAEEHTDPLVGVLDPSKRTAFTDDRVELKPCSSNPEHRPIVIDERTEDWEIVGVVVGAMVGPPRQGLPGP